MNKIKNLRRNKKGFTLVEVIVVLVILAILIAIAVPSVMKYIDDAKEAKFLAEARSAFIATDAELTKDYADDGILNMSASKEAEATAGFVELIKGKSDIDVKAIVLTDKKDTTVANPDKDGKGTTSPNDVKTYKFTFNSDGAERIVEIDKNGTATLLK